ncbi:hypothetical protein AA313_de0201769 [Arthrobotrys entomopaga]|nr:hypothetical protein AA313_de0201769 [Arthrobotrys entomopaga]
MREVRGMNFREKGAEEGQNSPANKPDYDKRLVRPVCPRYREIRWKNAEKRDKFWDVNRSFGNTSFVFSRANHDAQRDVEHSRLFSGSQHPMSENAKVQVKEDEVQARGGSFSYFSPDDMMYPSESGPISTRNIMERAPLGVSYSRYAAGTRLCLFRVHGGKINLP